jgi:hypothetical protein
MSPHTASLSEPHLTADSWQRIIWSSAKLLCQIQTTQTFTGFMHNQSVYLDQHTVATLNMTCPTQHILSANTHPLQPQS